MSAYKFRNAESRRMLHLNFLTNFYHSPDQQRAYEIKSALAYKGRLRDPIINNSVAREIVNLRYYTLLYRKNHLPPLTCTQISFKVTIFICFHSPHSTGIFLLLIIKEYHSTVISWNISYEKIIYRPVHTHNILGILIHVIFKIKKGSDFCN